jgi:hypothetical protein
MVEGPMKAVLDITLDEIVLIADQVSTVLGSTRVSLARQGAEVMNRFWKTMGKNREAIPRPSKLRRIGPSRATS